MQRVDSRLEQIVTNLATLGYAVVPGFFDPNLARQLYLESKAGWDRGRFHTAAVGRGKDRKVRTELRTDQVNWLNEKALTEAQTAYWAEMEQLRETLNRELFIGLNRFEAHLARFAPGGYYKPHLDCHKGSMARLLSTITYLDEDWSHSDGGQLRLYTDPVAGVEGPSIDVFPALGQLALFLSADYWHEVRVATRHRHSLTGWFRGWEEVATVIE